MHDRPRPGARPAALVGSLALVLVVTLRPMDGPNHHAFAPWAGTQLSLVNIVGNVLLFAFPGALLRSLGWSLGRSAVGGFALSFGIELVQLAIPGRTTSGADLICNTVGAAAGWWAAAVVAHRRHDRARTG